MLTTSFFQLCTSFIVSFMGACTS